MKILIVEDNDEMCRMIKSILADLTEQTCECGDGAEALSSYEWFRPDWVLMDIKMQKIDGITATRQIKKAFPDARIMIVSDYDDAKIREAAQKAGACEYVNKETLMTCGKYYLIRRRQSPVEGFCIQ